MGRNPDAVLKKLKAGNDAWIRDGGTADLSEKSVSSLVGGQFPEAVIVTCSDSRVIPEAIFHAGTGDLFVIRTAGNTIGSEAMGSIEYAVAHLDVRLVVILGHTGCGAVTAAVHGESGKYIHCITDRISQAVGSEKNLYKACCLNVRYSAEEVQKNLKNLIPEDAEGHGGAVSDKDVEVVGAVFHLESGQVEFL